VLWLLVFVAALASGLGFLGGVWWVFDLFAHFRLHYGLAFLIVLLVAAVRRRGGLAVLAAGGLAVNVALVLPLWTGGVPRPDGVAVGRMRVVQYNVLTSNRQKVPVVQWLARQDADLIVLQEVNDAWITAAESGLPGYRLLGNAVPRRDNFGMAMFARAALDVEHDAVVWDRVDVPRLEAVVRVGGVAIEVLGVHTLPPLGSHYATIRDGQLSEVEAWANDAGPHAVVLGDLNATPWSAPYRRLTRHTALRSAAAGYGPVGTWPAGAGQWLGIPLDHVLLGPGLMAVDFGVGPASSSDHRAVMADLMVFGPDPGD